MIIDDRPYGVYLVDPFYENTDEASSAQWPFHKDEVELVEEHSKITEEDFK